MFSVVIFDWDGTLADTRRAVVNAFQLTLRDVGCEVDDDFIDRRIGIGARNTFIEALNFNNMEISEEIIKGLIAKKVKTQLESIDDVELFEGAFELLTFLNPEVDLALASMNNRIVIDKLLEVKEVRRFFKAVVTVEEVQKPKPHPEIFLKCTAELGCKPEDCVVVEDSVFGVRAAKRARMSCVAIAQGAYSKDELQREYPDLLIKSINEKEKLLNFILY